VPARIGWGVDEAVMPTIPASRCSGSIVRVSGITGNIREALHTRANGTQVRPTLLVCDDPQTDQSARSILQTAERLGVVNGAISGLAGPGERTAIIIPCTVIQHGDLADQLLDRQKNPSWHGERTKLVYSFPTATKLWAEYARIRDESLRADGDGHEATEFYAARREQMDAGAEVAWPDLQGPVLETNSPPEVLAIAGAVTTAPACPVRPPRAGVVHSAFMRRPARPSADASPSNASTRPPG
jgi:hypothetical protein